MKHREVTRSTIKLAEDVPQRIETYNCTAKELKFT